MKEFEHVTSIETSAIDYSKTFFCGVGANWTSLIDEIESNSYNPSYIYSSRDFVPDSFLKLWFNVFFTDSFLKLLFSVFFYLLLLTLFNWLLLYEFKFYSVSLSLYDYNLISLFSSFEFDVINYSTKLSIFAIIFGLYSYSCWSTFLGPLNENVEFIIWVSWSVLICVICLSGVSNNWRFFGFD